MFEPSFYVRCQQSLSKVLAYGKTVPYGEKYFINYAVAFGMSKEKAQEMWDHIKNVNEKDSHA